MDFNLTEQEKMLQSAARDCATSLIKPRAAEIDRTNQFPAVLIEELGKHGYRGLLFPTEYGGSGAGYLSYALVLEQVARAYMSVAAIMAINTVPEEAVFRFGNEWQKKTFLTPLAQGKKLSCIAFTEAETGSDPEAIMTFARRSGNGYQITGEKHFVSMAPAANLALVFTKHEGKGLNAFMVDTSSPGYIIREATETMGMRGLGLSVISLDDIYVPRENLIGTEGQGYEILLEGITLGKLGAAIVAVGGAQSALELSIEYSKHHRARGKPIARMPTIQWHLAEMASRIEAARWLVYRTAFIRDQGSSIRYESSLAKLFASQVAVEVTRMAMQVHGSYGTIKNLALERLYRDAKMTEIYPGVSEIQRNIIASYLTR